MIGTKLYKNQYQGSEYTKLALYCNKNNAHIEDKGDYYEAVENEPVEPVEVVPTLTLDEMNEVLLAIIDRIDGGES